MIIILTNSFIKILLVVMFTTVSILFAQDSLKHKLKDVVVTSSRNPISQSEIIRSTEKIDSLKLELIPVTSLQDILNYSNNVDLRQRGTNGVQADVGMRGGTFEQTLIMIDGIKIIDPQTGHHNLNLPLSLNSIERIEIVKGGTASIHGPNAFSGVINFIAKRNRNNSITTQAEAGEYGYFAGSFFGSINFGNVSNNISFEKSTSNGYRANTEYDITNFSYAASVSGTKSVFDVFVGYSEKDFGANSFYSERFPLQAEHTITKFLKASAEVGSNELNFSADAYWRRNDDEFVLDKTNPGFYKNNHQTNIYGTELEIFLSSNLGNTSLGGEYVYDNIESNNLGNRNRDRKGIFLEHQFTEFSNFRISISGYVYNYSTIGWKLWPGLGIGYRVTENLNLFGNVGKALRIPTYTELFYSDPVTEGNPNLIYEETLNYEIGIIFQNTQFEISSSLFRKEGINLIDWVREIEDEPWRAMNISSVITNGFEVNFRSNLQVIFGGQFLNFASVAYTYLNSDKQSGEFESRYLLEYLQNQLIVSFGHNFWGGINLNWFLRYEDRLNVENHFLVDLKINKSIPNFDFYIKTTNLFNTSYNDIAGVPLPGRWVIGGIRFSLQ